MTPEPVITDADQAAALVALVRHGIRPDVQELLIYGSKTHGIPPGALNAALAAFLKARVPERISTPHYDPVYGSSGGWNACRDAVLRGKG